MLCGLIAIMNFHGGKSGDFCCGGNPDFGVEHRPIPSIMTLTVGIPFAIIFS
jgi:hypothetical protein